jgi:glc operon protein GlcG
MKLRILTAVMALTTLPLSSLAQTLTTESLSLDGANQVIQTVIGKARQLHAPGGAIAVVDAGGNLIAAARLDGTFAASTNISIGKARTAAIFQRPTKAFEEIVNSKGRTTMVALPDFTPLQGGVPIMVNDMIVGAVGVSGAASADQDEELAQSGAAAFANHQTTVPTAFTNPGKSEVQYLDHDSVAKAWQHGMPLVENDEFKIHASRRDVPGMVEIHRNETDIGYVVSGSALLVTGGSVTDPKEVADGELRGTSIRDGQSNHLEPGDVFVIPQGTPHWFKEVNGPFLYFVVKPINHFEVTR